MRYMFKFLSLLLVALLAVPVLAQDAETIEIGAEVDGSLEADSASAEYSFTGEQGQFIIITLTSDDFDAYLRLLDEEGSEIATDDDSAGSLNARIGPLEIPANGDYTIVASSLSGNTAGDYTLSVETQTLTTIEYGQTIEGELTTAELSKVYRFTGQAGDTINVRLSSEEFDSYLELSSDSETTFPLLSDDDSAGNRNANLGPYTLTETGGYLITARSFGANAEGAFTLEFDKVEVQTLEIGDSVDTVLEEDDLLYFQFEGTAGTEINIDVDSDDEIDTTLTLKGPQGYQLASDDDSGGRLDPSIRGYLLSEDGTYSIMVSPFSSSDNGELIISLTQNELKSLDEDSQTLRFSEKQQRDSVTFEGIEGEQVRLTFVVQDEGSISPSITMNQGSENLGYFSFASVEEASFVTTIPADGQIIVTIEEYSYDNNQVTVTLERIEAEE